MAILEVRVYQEFFGNQLVNTWHFLSSGTPAVVSKSFAAAASLGFIPGVGATGDSVYTRLKELQHTSLQYQEIQVINPYDPVDFYVQPLTVANTGAGTGVALSPTMALGIRTNRVRTDIRRGFKRIGGIGDGGMNPGGALGTSKLTGLFNLCNELNDIPDYDDEGNLVSLESIVLSKQEYTTSGGNRAYQYYPTETEQLQHIATGVQWTWVDTIRTQTTRQYGRGV